MPQILDKRAGEVREMTDSEIFDHAEERVNHFRDLAARTGCDARNVIRSWEDVRDRALDRMIDAYQEESEDWSSRRYRNR